MSLPVLPHPLYLPRTEITPELHFDAAQGSYLIKGRSLPQNVLAFYEPALDFFEQLRHLALAAPVLIIELEYYNSGTTHILTRLFAALSHLPGASVRWFYDPEDEDIQAAGEDFATLSSVPVHLMQIQN